MVRSRGSGASLRVDAFRVNDVEVPIAVAAAAATATLPIPVPAGVVGVDADKSVVWAIPTTCSGASNGLATGS